MKSTKKAPYQAPGIGDLDLYLERGILNTSNITGEDLGGWDGSQPMGGENLVVWD